jgi:PhnB protein
MALYAQAFGHEARMTRTYDDYVPDGVVQPPENLSDWILHAEMEIAGATVWLADEVLEKHDGNGNVKLVATAPTAAEARRVFELLSDGGHVTLPPVETFYSAFHAGLVDRFRVRWDIIAEESPKE